VITRLRRGIALAGLLVVDAGVHGGATATDAIGTRLPGLATLHIGAWRDTRA